MGCLRRVSAPQYVKTPPHIASLCRSNISKRMPCILQQIKLSLQTPCLSTEGSKRSTQVHHRRTQASRKPRRGRIIRCHSKSLLSMLQRQILHREILLPTTSWSKTRKAGHRLNALSTLSTKLNFQGSSLLRTNNSTCSIRIAASPQTSARTAKRCISTMKHSDIRKNTFLQILRCQMGILEI